jgi:hypothetical protein
MPRRDFSYGNSPHHPLLQKKEVVHIATAGPRTLGPISTTSDHPRADIELRVIYRPEKHKTVVKISEEAILGGRAGLWGLFHDRQTSFFLPETSATQVCQHYPCNAQSAFRTHQDESRCCGETVKSVIE